MKMGKLEKLAKADLKFKNRVTKDRQKQMKFKESLRNSDLQDSNRMLKLKTYPEEDEDE